MAIKVVDRNPNFNNEKAIAEYQQTGNEELRNEIIEQNLKLVVHEAGKYNHPAQLELDDLIIVGSMGLIKAIDKYNPNSGNTFSTYAGRSIGNHIRTCIGEWHADGKHRFGEIFRKYISISTSTFGKDYRKCSEEEADYVLNMMFKKGIIDSKEQYDNIRSMVLSKKILDSNIKEVESIPVEEEEFDRTKFIREHREELFSVLTDEEKELIELIFTLGYKETDLIDKYNMTHQGVHNRKSRALQKMRKVAQKYL